MVDDNDNCQAGGVGLSVDEAIHKYTSGADVSALLARIGQFAATIEGGADMTCKNLLAMMVERSNRNRLAAEDAQEATPLKDPPSTHVEIHGHAFNPEYCDGIPRGREGWECSRCTLFVMTARGTTPATATTIHLSMGSFNVDLWHRWTCEAYRASTPTET